MRHIVIFKYKPQAKQADIQRLTEAFGNLQHKIPGIISFEHGINNSPEGKNLGFTHIYVLTFEDIKARDVYLPHPEHVKFIQLLQVFVVDYNPE